MSEAGDLAEKLAIEVGVPFDRRKFDHDELLTVVRDVRERTLEEIMTVRSEVRSLDKKMDGLKKTLNVILWITCLLLGALVGKELNLF